VTINEDNFIEQLRRKNENALYYVIDIYGGLIKSIAGRHLYKLKPLQEECIDFKGVNSLNRKPFFVCRTIQIKCKKGTVGT